MNNGDLVRQMDNSQLEILWAKNYFPEQYHEDCEKCNRVNKCNFMVQACPKTFRNWLDGEAGSLPWKN